MKRIVIALAASACSAAAASSADGAARPRRPSAQRIPVLGTEATIEVDPALADDRRSPCRRRSPMPIGRSPAATPSKSMGHVALGDAPAQAWSVSIGDGQQRRRRGSPPSRWSPTAGSTRSTRWRRVRAFNAETGAHDLGAPGARREQRRARPCSAAASASTMAGSMRPTAPAMPPRSTRRPAAIVWMVKPGGPLRGAPTIANDNVYVLSQDNQLYALNAAERRDALDRRRLVRAGRRVRQRRAGLRPEHGRRRLLVGRAHRLSLRERPGRLAGRAGAHRHLDHGRHALRHRRRSGDRQGPRLRGRPGRPHGRGRADHRPARLGNQHRRHLDALGRGRLGVRRHRPGAAARGRARLGPDPLDLAAASFRAAERATSERTARRVRGSDLLARPVLAGNRLVLASSSGQIVYVSPVDGAIQSTIDRRRRLAADRRCTPVVLATTTATAWR